MKTSRDLLMTPRSIVYGHGWTRCCHHHAATTHQKNEDRRRRIPRRPTIGMARPNHITSSPHIVIYLLHLSYKKEGRVLCREHEIITTHLDISRSIMLRHTCSQALRLKNTPAPGHKDLGSDPSLDLHYSPPIMTPIIRAIANWMWGHSARTSITLVSSDCTIQA